MDGTAVEQIASLAQREALVVEVDGKAFCAIPLIEVKPAKETDPALNFVAPPALVLGTLTGFCDYIQDNPDKVANGETFGREGVVAPTPRPKGARLIHVKSPTCVELLSAYQADDNNSRMCFVRAEVKPQPFPFGVYMDREGFQIMLQARFAPTGDSAKLLSRCSSSVCRAVAGGRSRRRCSRPTLASGPSIPRRRSKAGSRTRSALRSCSSFADRRSLLTSR